MRIVSVKDAVVPISSRIANAYVDFCKMTASVVAITGETGDVGSATGFRTSRTSASRRRRTRTRC
jgi:D(-)-tartrate dehydratase